MKEMIYNGAIDHREILEDRVTDDGYRIVVLNLGTHPTAYVRIPDESRMLRYGFNAQDINVHGGITFFGSDVLGVPDAKGHTWIGWDYGHFRDYLKYYTGHRKNKPIVMHGKKYTTEEIIEEAEHVVDQLRKMNYGGVV